MNKMIDKKRFKEFSKDVEKYTNGIDTKESLETKGKVKKIVFSRMMWAESLLWFSFIQFLIILLGLMDDVIDNINSGIKDIYALFGNHNPFQFPVDIASFVALALIVFFFCFGFVGYKYLRTPQTTSMISIRNSGGYYMLWDMCKQIQDELEELKKDKK